MQQKKVLYIAAECKPFSKVGGVGDVAGELPPALRKKGIDIEVVTPFYACVDSRHVLQKTDTYTITFANKKETVDVYSADLRGVPVSLLKNKTYFEGAYGIPYIHSDVVPFRDDVLRFSFFSTACLELIRDRQPEIVHINDWVLGYLFGLMAMHSLPQKRVLTIHNIGYQGNIGIDAVRRWDILKLLEHARIGPLFRDPRRSWKSVNALRLGLELAHMCNTVSPTYGLEITKPERPEAFFEGGKGLEKITARLRRQGKLLGILNGFEYAERPSDRAFARKLQAKAKARQTLAASFESPEACVLGFVGRAVEQKFRLLTEVFDGRSTLEHILEMPGVNVAILATGVPAYEKFLRELASRFPKKFACFIAFDKQLADNISLGSDIFLMPSLFEPCGITQMISMSHATPPLVRSTGGLRDTVILHTEKEGTGFGFVGETREQILRNMVKTVKQAVRLFNTHAAQFGNLQRNAFKQRFTWPDAAASYVSEIYQKVSK